VLPMAMYAMLLGSALLSILAAPLLAILAATAISGVMTSIITLMVIGLTLLALIRIAHRWSRGWRITIRPELIIALCYMLISTLVNFETDPILPTYLIRWTFPTLVLPLTLLSAPLLIHNARSRALVMIIAAGMGLAAITVLMFSGPSGQFPSLEGVIRTRSDAYAFGNRYAPTTLASLSSLTFVTIISMWSAGLLKGNRALILIASPIAIVGVFASQGRMAFLATCLGTASALSCGLLRRTISKRHLIGIFSILSLAAIAVLSLMQISATNMTSRILEIPSALANPNRDRSLSNRMAYWEDMASEIKSNPMGVGFDRARESRGYTAHNEFLGVAAGAGIPGVLLYSLLWIFLFGRCFALCLGRSSGCQSRFAIVGISVWLVASMIGITEMWSISNSVFAVFVWTILAISSDGIVRLGHPARARKYF